MVFAERTVRRTTTNCHPNADIIIRHPGQVGMYTSDISWLAFNIGSHLIIVHNHHWIGMLSDRTLSRLGVVAIYHWWHHLCVREAFLY